MEMDFDAAILVHSKWKRRLQDFVAGKSTETLDRARIARDDVCDLGKWIETQRAALAGDADFRNLIARHKDFHERAAEVVALCEAGTKDLAQKALDPTAPYSRASAGVVNAIVRLRTRTPSPQSC